MFLIAGITPKIKVLDAKPVICPVCGLAQAYYKRVDHWLNLFFIPLFRVKTGEPFLMCERCERNIHELGDDYHQWLDKTEHKCIHCGNSLHQDFRYCPFCGKAVKVRSALS